MSPSRTRDLVHSDSVRLLSWAGCLGGDKALRAKTCGGPGPDPWLLLVPLRGGGCTTAPPLADCIDRTRSRREELGTKGRLRDCVSDSLPRQCRTVQDISRGRAWHGAAVVYPQRLAQCAAHTMPKCRVSECGWLLQPSNFKGLFTFCEFCHQMLYIG